MSKLTLVAPAGNFPALAAAVQNGADVVYLGLKLFNARRLADNFTKEELPQAVQYAHQNGVKVYLALNTLIKNNEISPFLNLVSYVAQCEIDALILQDLTFAPLLKQAFPEIEIHASTQATITNSAAVKYWQPYVDKFILARELTKEEIKAIYNNTNAKLEVFVHGHLCVSYSGQCLISSLIGERSGNRGMCASSCRKQYNGNGYLLSAKDLCMIRNIKDVAESGAMAVKIEGRMKPAEYVAITTKAYREQIDALAAGKTVEVTDDNINELKLAFNREFTSGYFNGETKIVDPTYSSKRGVYLGLVENNLLLLKEDLEVHDGIGLIERGKRIGDYVRRILVNGSPVNKAKKGEYVKLATKGFHNGAMVYLMTKNKGHDVLEAARFSQKINQGIGFSSPIDAPVYQKTMSKEKKIHVRVYSLLGVSEALEAGADFIYYDAFSSDINNAMKMAGNKLCLHTPMAMHDSDIERLRKIVEKIKPAGMMVNNVGVLGMCWKMNLKIPLVLGEQMNIFNDQQLYFYGYPAVASLELSLKELESFQDKANLWFYAHGRPAVMTFKEKFTTASLRDKKRYTFRLRKTGTGAMEMLYSKSIGILQHTQEVVAAGLTNFYLDLENDVSALVLLYRRLLNGEAVSVKSFKSDVTIGNLRKGVK